MSHLWKIALVPLVLASVCPALGQGKTKTTSPIIVKHFKTTLDMATMPVDPNCGAYCWTTQPSTVYTAPVTGLYRISTQVIRHIDENCLNGPNPTIWLSLGVSSASGQVPASLYIHSQGCGQGVAPNDTAGNAAAPASMQANAGSMFQWSVGVISFSQAVYTGTIDVYIVIERLM